MKTKTLPTTEPMNHSSRHCGTVAALLIALALACFALSPHATAVCQQGCDLSNDNTAVGVDALSSNTTGNGNIALGNGAGTNLSTDNNNIDIGNAGFAGQSGTIRIGTKSTHRDTFIAGISGVTVPTGVAVIVNANGHLGTTTSSERFKEAIKP